MPAAEALHQAVGLPAEGGAGLGRATVGRPKGCGGWAKVGMYFVRLVPTVGQWGGFVFYSFCFFLFFLFRS